MKNKLPGFAFARSKSITALGLALGMTVSSGILNAADVLITFTNTGPANGLWIMRPWVGFHDGTFDTFNVGGTASPGLESVAEDGIPNTINSEFQTARPGNSSAFFNGAPTPPGASVSLMFSLDPMDANTRYFNFTMMVIPGNDGFVGNDNPLSHQIFDAGGNFIGANFSILGSDVLDAGSEVNDEVPANTAFFGQMAPNTGTAQGGVIGAHPGFMTAASGNILGDPMFAAADFKQTGYQVASVTVQLVPEPSSVALLGLGGLALMLRRRK